MISREHLEKFKELYKDKYNIALSDEEATELATHFLNLMKVLVKPKVQTAKNYQEGEIQHEIR